MTDTQDDIVFRGRSISQSYPGVRALADVDIDLKVGQVHALVGENGAGKSTLARIIAGIETPETGQMLIDTQIYKPTGRREAQNQGVRIVMQELNLKINEATFKLLDPIGYLQFLAMQKKAAVVITDSGGIQEETTYLGIPCLTVRENTERPVTITTGTNLLVGQNMKKLTQEVERILTKTAETGAVPPLWDGKASDRIAAVVTQWWAAKSSTIN